MKSDAGRTDAAATDAPTTADARPLAGEFLVAHLRAIDSRLAEASPRILAGSDEEAVHDLRVELRRARTLLEVGRPVLGRFYADEVRLALRDVHRVSGTLRDEEVLLDILVARAEAIGNARPEVAGGVSDWIAARRRRERRLRSALKRSLRDGALERGRALMNALLAFRIKPSREKRLLKFARRAVDDALREVERRRAGPLEDSEALHRLRITYKRLRYTVEAFEGVLPPELAGLAQPAARFQSRLGRLHDTDMAIAAVKGAPNLLEAARDALLVELEHVRQDRVAAFERELGAKAPAATAPPDAP